MRRAAVIAIALALGLGLAQFVNANDPPEPRPFELRPLDDPIERLVGLSRALPAATFLMSSLLLFNAAQTGSLVLLPISRRSFRSFNRWAANTWWGWCVTLSKRINDVRIIVSGDDVPSRGLGPPVTAWAPPLRPSGAGAFDFRAQRPLEHGQPPVLKTRQLDRRLQRGIEKAASRGLDPEPSVSVAPVPPATCEERWGAAPRQPAQEEVWR